MRDAPFCVYQAAEGFLADLLTELDREPAELVVRGDLVFAPGPATLTAWAQNIWLDARLVEAPSIGAAAKALRAIQRNWRAHPTHLNRRAALITQQLPTVSAKALVFGEPAPTAPLGAWTPWDEGLLVASPACSSPFPDGAAQFVEDREGAPSRAYLKLWEALTLLGERPGPGELCLDLGASPGGWTWVLAELGARVFSLDRAPLEARIARRPNVEHCLGSGFGLEPESAGGPGAQVDWLFSDMACYPERLLELIGRWLAAYACRNFVCTLKFQGPTDHATARAFAAIPGSRLVHLWHNKHELTWMLRR